jgi:Ca2+-binding RTX toxin-like protein
MLWCNRREVHALSIRLEDGGNDVMDGGDDDDVIIGQRGDDTISGGYGNDVLIGDGITLPSAALANAIIPTAISATRIVSQSNVFGANLTLSIDTTVGTLMISPMTMLPREMELPITSVESVGGWSHRSLEWFEDRIPGFAPLQANYKFAASPSSPRDVAYFRAQITYAGTVMHHPKAVYGNNNLRGDQGNDTLVGGSVWANAWSYTQSTTMDEARTRTLTLAESANMRLSLLAHQLDQWRRIAFWQDASTARPCPMSDITLACDSINGGSDMDIIIGDDLLLATVAPIFLSNSGGTISSSNDSAIIDIYQALRDIEVVALYLDGSLFSAQQDIVASLDSWLYKYRYSQHILPCSYATINIGSDTLKQSDGSGIMVGNHLALASSTSHSYTTVDSSALLAARHARNVDFVFAWTWSVATIPVKTSATADVYSSYIDRIQCYNDDKWTYGTDAFFGSCESDNDLVIGNIAVFGTYMKSSVPLPSGHNGGDMLEAIEESIARTLDAIEPHSSGSIDFMSSYDYTYFAESGCQATPMFVEAINDAHGQSRDTYVLHSSAYTYDSVSTAITFDPATASASNGGISALPILSFDAVSSDNHWSGWFGLGWWLGGQLGTSPRSSLNNALAPKMASLSWLWATNANASIAAVQQPSAIEISPITSGWSCSHTTQTYTLTQIRRVFFFTHSIAYG